MRIALGVSRTAVLLVAGVVAGCATASPGGGSASGDLPGLALLPAPERQQVIDSLQAEQIAEEDGPRVRVSANFQNEGGSRRVDAIVRADDDAYILVGHIDATGTLRIVYPKHPGDGEFVRGGHSYRVPEFFGGFADEYRYRRAADYERLSTVRSRRDSYDAGTGYVFVIASWRPMHVERVTDGDRWSSYEISSDEYLNDPREAVDELAQVVAGDGREAYTVEYAHYTSTNYGMYAANAFDRCSFATYGNTYGFGTLGFTGFSPVYGGFGFRGYGLGITPFFGGGYFGTIGLPAFGFLSPVGYMTEYDAATGCSYYAPTYARPLFVSYWPLPQQVQRRGLSGFKPGLPTPPKLGGVPILTAPTAQPAARRRPTIADLTATDLNGMSPSPRSTPPSIEQMLRRRLHGGAATTDAGAALLRGAPVLRPGDRRYAPPDQAEPRFESPRQRPRYAPRPATRPEMPAAEPRPQAPHPAPRMAPPPHFEPPPMRAEPTRPAAEPRPSGSSGSSSERGGKPRP